jgi:putative hydrolase of HD superfamily
MKNILKFLIKAGELKTTPRPLWKKYRIKEAESFASHTFRSAIIGWILSKKKKLDEEKTIKTILVYNLLKSNSKNNKKGKKEKIWFSLVSRLPSNFRKEFKNIWLNIKKKPSKEIKFALGVEELENFLQAVEYWRLYKKPPMSLWGRWMINLFYFNDPLLLEIIDTIYKKFLNTKTNKILSSNRELVEFFLKTGRLKRMPRRGWLLRKIKNPETIAEHSFRVALMAWVFGLYKKDLNLKEIIIMALIHDLCEIYAGDATPYDKLLLSYKNKKEREKLFEKWPRMSRDEKLERLFEKHKKEWKSLLNLTLRLPPQLKREIVNLWSNYESGFSKEGRFIRQIDKLENLLQALEYFKKNKKFPIGPWWVEIEETIDDPVLLKFLKVLDKEFSSK